MEEGDLLEGIDSFWKKIISTLADKDMVVREEINGGDVRDNCRRSTRLVERCKMSDGRDVQKGGDERVEIHGKGGDRRWRILNW